MRAHPADDHPVAPPWDLTGYELELDEDFRGPALDPTRWLPYHLPQWSSRAASAARYDLDDDGLVLRVDADQPPWCPELDGGTRVSNLQTGVFAGPLGSPVGQHRFSPDAVVREEQPTKRLYTPYLGVIEVRCAASADPDAMVALWMIGFEDEPDRSGEICVCEIFGRDVEPGRGAVGMGVHPFGDPTITDDFARVPLDLDLREPHDYAVRWGPDRVDFYVDRTHVRTVDQSPRYPMQLMLGIYDFTNPERVVAEAYPKRFRVSRVRGHRPRG